MPDKKKTLCFRFRKWRETNRGEILKFLALVLAMGLVKHENLTDFWSRSPVTSTPFWPSNISRDKFLLLMSFFHLADNTFHVPRGAEGHDPLFKLGVVYHSILNRFATSYQPHQFLSIDEGMVPWQGNMGISVYSPNKPVK